MAVLRRGLVNQSGGAVRLSVFDWTGCSRCRLRGMAVAAMISGNDVRNTIDGIWAVVVFCYIATAAISFVAGIVCSWMWGLLR